jgi:hypothetical protein
VTALVRLQLVELSRSRRAFPPLLAMALLLLGVYAYRPNPVLGTYTLTAFLFWMVALWLGVAIGLARERSQREVLEAAAGGDRVLAAQVLCGGLLAAVLAVVAVAFPIVTNSFGHHVRPTAVEAALVAHLLCGACGVAVAALLSPPHVSRGVSALALGLVLVGLSAAVPSPPRFVASQLDQDTAGAALAHVPLGVVAAVPFCALALAGAVALRRARA